MYVARPIICLIASGTAAAGVALATVAVAGLDQLAEFGDRLATLGILALVAWLALSSRALSRQNAALAARQAELHEQVVGFANRGHVAAAETNRQLGYLHSDRREDDQHRIHVLTQLKALGPRIDARLVAVGEEQYSGGYADALDQRPPAPPTHLRLVP